MPTTRQTFLNLTAVNDAGAGTSVSPYKTPSTADNVANHTPVAGDTIEFRHRNGAVKLEENGSTHANQQYNFNTTKVHDVHLVFMPDTGEVSPWISGPDIGIQILLGASNTQVPASITLTSYSTRPDFPEGKPVISLFNGSTADIATNIVITDPELRWTDENRTNRLTQWGVARKLTGDMTVTGMTAEACVTYAGFQGGFSGTISVAGTNNFGTAADYGAGSTPQLYGWTAGGTHEVGNIIDAVTYTGETVCGLLSMNPTVTSGDKTIDVSNHSWGTVSTTTWIDITDLQATGTGTLQLVGGTNAPTPVSHSYNGYILRQGAYNDPGTLYENLVRATMYNAATKRLKMPIGSFRLINPSVAAAAGIAAIGPQVAGHGVGESFRNCYWMTPNDAGHTTSLSANDINWDGYNWIEGGDIAYLMYGDRHRIINGGTLVCKGKTPFLAARSGDAKAESAMGFDWSDGTLIIYHTRTYEEYLANPTADGMAAFTDRGYIGSLKTMAQYIAGGRLLADLPDPYGPNAYKGNGVGTGTAGLDWITGKTIIIRMDPRVPFARFGRPTGASTFENQVFTTQADIQRLRDFARGTGEFTAQGPWFYSDPNAFADLTVVDGGSLLSRNKYGVGLGLGLGV